MATEHVTIIRLAPALTKILIQQMRLTQRASIDFEIAPTFPALQLVQSLSYLIKFGVNLRLLRIGLHIFESALQIIRISPGFRIAWCLAHMPLVQNIVFNIFQHVQ
jgi:hypothetical protein